MFGLRWLARELMGLNLAKQKDIKYHRLGKTQLRRDHD